MLRLSPTLWIVPVLACGLPARAGEQPDRPARPSPRVGLVLSGGGARGAAHIGVLKVLEREQIPIDCIAGTSFGALVGGFYALGYSAAEIEKIFAAQDWDDLFSDSPDRRLAPIARRRDFRYLAQLDFRRLTPELPSGMWGGQKLTQVVDSSVSPIEAHTFGYDTSYRLSSNTQGPRGTLTYTYLPDDRVLSASLA